MSPDGRVGVLVHDDGEGVRRSQVGIEPEPDDHQHVLSRSAAVNQ
jgi:hypothetical protein